MPTVGTGYDGLDLVLPGGGWPCGAMTEVLQPQPSQHEWGLVAPALGVLQASSSNGLLVLVGAPYCPIGPTASARQIIMLRLLLQAEKQRCQQRRGFAGEYFQTPGPAAECTVVD